MVFADRPADRRLRNETIGAARSFRKSLQDNDSGSGSPRLSPQIDELAHGWAKDGKGGVAMINAKAETVAE
jgi:hypothetical protein